MSEGSRGLNVGLWVVQGLLAAMFAMAGFMKLTSPIEDLVAMGMTYPLVLGTAVTRFIGVSELLGAIGLILPAALRIVPQLTGVAAACLGLVMALAIAYHGSQGEVGGIPVNVVLLALSAFVAWGRLVRAPIAPR